MSEHQEHGYETRDAQLKPLVVFAIGLATLAVVSCIAVALLEDAFTRSNVERQTVHPMAGKRERPSAPLLQATTRDDIAAHRAWEEEQLGLNDWIDRENGVVQIPIEQAMKRVVEVGLPVREGGGE